MNICRLLFKQKIFDAWCNLFHVASCVCATVALWLIWLAFALQRIGRISNRANVTSGMTRREARESAILRNICNACRTARRGAYCCTKYVDKRGLDRAIVNSSRGHDYHPALTRYQEHVIISNDRGIACITAPSSWMTIAALVRVRMPLSGTITWCANRLETTSWRNATSSLLTATVVSPWRFTNTLTCSCHQYPFTSQRCYKLNCKGTGRAVRSMRGGSCIYGGSCCRTDIPVVTWSRCQGSRHWRCHGSFVYSHSAGDVARSIAFVL